MREMVSSAVEGLPPIGEMVSEVEDSPTTYSVGQSTKNIPLPPMGEMVSETEDSPTTYSVGQSTKNIPLPPIVKMVSEASESISPNGRDGCAGEGSSFPIFRHLFLNF